MNKALYKVIENFRKKDIVISLSIIFANILILVSTIRSLSTSIWFTILLIILITNTFFLFVLLVCLIKVNCNQKLLNIVAWLSLGVLFIRGLKYYNMKTLEASSKKIVIDERIGDILFGDEGKSYTDRFFLKGRSHIVLIILSFIFYTILQAISIHTELLVDNILLPYLIYFLGFGLALIMSSWFNYYSLFKAISNKDYVLVQYITILHSQEISTPNMPDLFPGFITYLKFVSENTISLNPKQ